MLIRPKDSAVSPRLVPDSVTCSPSSELSEMGIPCSGELSGVTRSFLWTALADLVLLVWFINVMTISSRCRIWFCTSREAVATLLDLDTCDAFSRVGACTYVHVGAWFLFTQFSQGKFLSHLSLRLSQQEYGKRLLDACVRQHPASCSVRCLEADTLDFNCYMRHVHLVKPIMQATFVFHVGDLGNSLPMSTECAGQLWLEPLSARF